MAMNVFEFATMLGETAGCEVRGFQSLPERAAEKATMEAILAEHATEVDIDRFLAGEIKASGLMVAYLNHESGTTRLYEMSGEASENWRTLSAADELVV